MIKIVLVIAIVGCASAGEGVRQKRLLFYDEDGNLIKLNSNPYWRNLGFKSEQLPGFGRFMNPLFGVIKNYGSPVFAYSIPVSDEVINHMQNDPNYQNKLFIFPKKEAVVEPNALCQGIRGQIPSPTTCPNYLNCWDGWGIEQECPQGLMFSAKGYCDLPDSVECGIRQYKEPFPSEPRCRHDFDSFMNKKDCNEFFVCVGRQPVKFKCPANLAYSEPLGVCDYPTRVSCPSAVNNGVLFPPAEEIAAVSPVQSDPIPIASDPVPPVNPTTPAPPVTLPPIQTPKPPSMADLIPSAMQPGVQYPRDIAVYSENSLTNTQKWSSTQIAMSRQDAIRQLNQENH